MDYGQHLVTTLVCFVKAEGEDGLLSDGAFVRGFLPGGLCARNLCPTPIISRISIPYTYKSNISKMVRFRDKFTKEH